MENVYSLFGSTKFSVISVAMITQWVVSFATTHQTKPHKLKSQLLFGLLQSKSLHICGWHNTDFSFFSDFDWFRSSFRIRIMLEGFSLSLQEVKHVAVTKSVH
ncbi:unnamed protein product [Ilex paraguariensis]|uniref:Uncharacterized protein n=1 Tax=Ilex paraguariensis TaxID=185542 RepID=A0ABC8RGX9_9AQUA